MPDGLAPQPLRLYWWAAKPNFGDTISRAICAWMSGREVAWAKPGQVDIFAIGSIMHVVRRGNRAPRDGDKPVVWGTGMLKPVQTDFLDNVEVACLRGPISEALLGVTVQGYGDPGILMADVIGDDIPRGDHIGLIPHFAQLDNPAFREMVAREPALRLIDVRDEAISVCRQIAGCAHVISSSLHGLIVADSFGVPNTWMDPDGIHASPGLKFHDYAAGITRAIGRPISPRDVPGLLGRLPTGDLPYADGIARSRADLLAAFPARLRVTAN